MAKTLSFLFMVLNDCDLIGKPINHIICAAIIEVGGMSLQEKTLISVLIPSQQCIHLGACYDSDSETLWLDLGWPVGQ